MQLRLLRAEADTKNPISEAPSPNPQAPSSSAPRRRRSRRIESATVASRSPSLTSERPPASACRIRSNALKWRRRHRHRRWTRVSGDKSHCGLLLPANQRLLMMNPTSFPRSNWHFDFLFSFLKFFYWFLVCVCVQIWNFGWVLRSLGYFGFIAPSETVDSNLYFNQFKDWIFNWQVPFNSSRFFMLIFYVLC